MRKTKIRRRRVSFGRTRKDVLFTPHLTPKFTNIISIHVPSSRVVNVELQEVRTFLKSV